MRVTPEQDDYLERLALRYGISVGEVVRRLIEQEMDFEGPVDIDRAINAYSRFHGRARRRPTAPAQDILFRARPEPTFEEPSPSSELETLVFRRSAQR